jgi:hypothetical protein
MPARARDAGSGRGETLLKLLLRLHFALRTARELGSFGQNACPSNGRSRWLLNEGENDIVIRRSQQWTPARRLSYLRNVVNI